MIPWIDLMGYVVVIGFVLALVSILVRYLISVIKGDVKVFETIGSGKGRVCSECKKPMQPRMISINELYVCRNEKCKHFGILVEVPILK